MARNDARKHYRTAKAIISCNRVHSGEFVAVEFSHDADNGVAWYLVTATEHGPIEPVAYPEHHLTGFCL